MPTSPPGLSITESTRLLQVQETCNASLSRPRRAPQIPLAQLAEITLTPGPAMIRDENGPLAGYVYVDTATTDIGGYVERAKRAIDEHLKLPGGYTLLWTGQYEFQVRARERFKILIPLVFFIIFMLLCLTFHSASEDDRDAFCGLCDDRWSHPAMAAGLQLLRRGLGGLHRAVLVMAALVPILWSTGVGSDIMKPIAAPIIGRMVTSTIHVLIITPVIFYLMKTRALRRGALRASGLHL
jgi:Cu(I)/Ag(I) efflux system membrane protein CusA/SilA